MSKHTPGPWEMRRDGFVYAANGERVCSPHSTLPDSAKWSKQLQDLRATARLIAAAPDLLDALEDMLGWQTLAPDDVVAAARAAIAKARGER
jgi:hypothetical protein